MLKCVENLGLYPKSNGKPKETFKQRRDISDLPSKKITLGVLWRADWIGTGRAAHEESFAMEQVKDSGSLD